MKGRGIKVSGKKYYAVRKGRVPGIYESWEEAEKQVKGFPGAEYKSFEKIEYAKAYLEGKDECTCPKLDEETMIAYVDGSYEVVCGSGVVLCYRGKKEEYYFWTDIDEFKDSRNIAGEIMAALFAMDCALKKGAKRLILRYDLEGLEKWATEEYRTKEPVTRVYKYYYEQFCKNGLEVIFEKVKSHSGDFCNDEADRLAKKAAKREANVEWFSLELRKDIEKTIEEMKRYTINPEVSINMDQKHFELMLQYLEEEGYHLEQSIRSSQRIVKVKSKYFRERLTLTYHTNTGNLQIQGKAHDVFKNVQLFLSEFESAERYKNFIKDIYGIEDKRGLEETLNRITKGAYGSELISEALKNELLTAYLAYLEEPTMPFKDFSFYLIPSVRVLEAFIEMGLQMITGKVEKINRIGDFFKWGKKDNSYKIRSDCIANCNLGDLSSALEKCYNFYHDYRHAYVHGSFLEGHTSIISEKSQVDDLIKQALELIGDLFEKYGISVK